MTCGLYCVGAVGTVGIIPEPEQFLMSSMPLLRQLTSVLTVRARARTAPEWQAELHGRSLGAQALQPPAPPAPGASTPGTSFCARFVLKCGEIGFPRCSTKAVGLIMGASTSRHDNSGATAQWGKRLGRGDPTPRAWEQQRPLLPDGGDAASVLVRTSAAEGRDGAVTWFCATAIGGVFLLMCGLIPKKQPEAQMT